MFRITAHYHHPKDREAFLEHYRTTHSVLAAKMPGLKAYGWGQATTLDGSRPEHFLVAVMDWETREEAAAAFASPEGQAATADMANFADAGVDVNFHEVTQVS
ncbi:EthD family reductase [Prauserella oleivorans]|uniref:EthD family reductase n=1 Tax=Prauserella oleivorans TaxID=1478153 RepID=A0ABW5W5Q7_9PSEU